MWATPAAEYVAMKKVDNILGHLHNIETLAVGI